MNALLRYPLLYRLFIGIVDQIFDLANGSILMKFSFDCFPFFTCIHTFVRRTKVCIHVKNGKQSKEAHAEGMWLCM